MKLGILVNTDKHLEDIIGVAGAAVSAGHFVTIFVMDDGTRLLEKPPFVELSGLERVTMCYCNYNAEVRGINKKIVPDEFVCGSQYENAIMIHESDKVIVL